MKTLEIHSTLNAALSLVLFLTTFSVIAEDEDLMGDPF
jgi:hypothetical protein